MADKGDEAIWVPHKYPFYKVFLKICRIDKKSGAVIIIYPFPNRYIFRGTFLLKTYMLFKIKTLPILLPIRKMTYAIST